MKAKKRYSSTILASFLWVAGVTVAHGAVNVQCDQDGNNDDPEANVKCMHLVAGDGFATMADGKTQYIFGFADVTEMPSETQEEKDSVIATGILANQWPAPSIVLEEEQEFYLSLTNVGMLIRPDLFDPHTVHFHGYPQSSTVFDGLPESGVSINMGSTLTYYYKLHDPGTYMYHCHVEATEHMQMGMLGSLYVKPAQNKGPAITHNGRSYSQFAYNDGDGSTGYDVEHPIQLGSFDGAFHDASESVQPLPFALMVDNYPMINGRGYPDTADARTYDFPTTEGSSATPANNPDNVKLQTSQPVSTRIEAAQGDRILLRISNLAITRYYTLQSSGIKMKVVGRDARLLRAPNGSDLYYNTNSVTLGGGESADVILDTSNVNPGTYVLYTANLNYLSNDQEQFGGMMTEIIIN